jgi:hypothetical protein
MFESMSVCSVAVLQVASRTSKSEITMNLWHALESELHGKASQPGRATVNKTNRQSTKRKLARISQQNEL